MMFHGGKSLSVINSVLGSWKRPGGNDIGSVLKMSRTFSIRTDLIKDKGP